MSEKGAGRAAAIGAAGCFGTFMLLGFIAAATGGSLYIDGGGIVLLLGIGAVIGLVVWAIYSKGRRDAFTALGPSRGRSNARPTDELMEEAERDFNAGLIDREEYDRRIRRAWGHE